MARKDSKARRHNTSRPQGIIELNPQGFGFVKTAEGDYFIPRSKTGGAFPGDLVEVSELPSRDARSKNHGRSSKRYRTHSSSQRPEARVTKVLARANNRVVGTYEIAEPFGVVVPENPAIHHDIFTLRKESPEVKDGDIVEVSIIDYPARNAAATGRVERVLGSADDPGIDVDLIIAEYGLATTFSPDALSEAEALSLEVEPVLAQGYADLRDRFIFTIDPIDARDFDDAIGCEKVGNLYHLTVCIADVSHYIEYGTALDSDAAKRATSTYLADRVLPMLPERISNYLCSLVPDEDRLTLTVEAYVRGDGSLESYDLYPSVMQSKARLSYEQALTLLDATSDQAACEAFSYTDTPQGAHILAQGVLQEAREAIRTLTELADIRFARRYQQGCMDFDRVEARVKLDDEGHPIDIHYRHRTKTTHAIEEAMILANEIVAQWLCAQGFPCVYRVHDIPDLDALRALYPILQELPAYRHLDKQGLLAGDPRVLQEILSVAEKLPEKELVNALVLKSMKRAVYKVDDDPHFGLALEHYCHFTSPIRRYPDLLVHRMVKQAFFGKSETFEAQKNALPLQADHSSKQERTSEKAARQSQIVKLIEYLEDYIGERFEGVVSSVSTFGLMIRLENTVSGLLPIDALGDEYFAYDYARSTLTGVDTGQEYRLGQTLSVIIMEADHRQRKLTFGYPRS